MQEVGDLKPVFLEDRLITSTNIDAREGSYALDTTPFAFETCRERFAGKWNQKTLGFYLKIPDDCSRNVACFILKTEKILKRRTFSQYANTNRQSIMWIQPAFFWKSSRMRRSFFTILVRAATSYIPSVDNYEAALYGYHMFYDTRSAVMRFLFGFTVYSGPAMHNTSLEVSGWRNIFSGKDVSWVRSALIAPKKSRYTPSFNPKGELWV